MSVRCCVVFVVLGSVLAGCGSVTPVSPSPSPTWECTPEAGGTPYPCGEVAFDRMKASDELYAQAEPIARAYLAEDIATKRDPHHTLSPEVSAKLSGTMVRALATYAQSLLHDNEWVDGPNPPVVWVRRNVGLSKYGSVVSMNACVDWTGSRWYFDGQPSLAAGRATYSMYFGPAGADMKLIVVDEQEGDQPC